MAVAAKKRSSSGKGSVAAARGKKKPAAASGRRGARVSGSTAEFVKSVAGMVLIFLFVRAFFVEAFRIPSGSMIPTLLVGDWLFVNKLVYGPHVPFTNVSLPGYAEPRRGEVVVFQSPTQIDQPEDPTPILVKRLIGMPGDTIYMRQAVVYVNGIAQRQGYGAAANEAGDPNETNPLFEWQKNYALAASRFGGAPATPTHDNWGPLVIPPQHYMMLGDNRYNSKDSRYWGFVPRANVRGRPIFVYYSYDTEAGLPFLRGFTEIRWGRIGHRIQ
ncbi:MAG TPA: signal peptidase I [Gemmatimonadaceae bacterium]|nr:signal peptidase I [Gemmatimonadaceae bacterium]